MVNACHVSDDVTHLHIGEKLNYVNEARGLCLARFWFWRVGDARCCDWCALARRGRGPPRCLSVYCYGNEVL